MAEKQNLVGQNRIAEAVRQACVEAALAAYEDAGISGLCYEGRWECAVDAMRALNITAVIEQIKALLSDQPNRKSDG